MHKTQTVVALNALTPDATYAEAKRWVRQVRRVLDRWDALPDAALRLMTPELKKEAYAELDLLQEWIERDMALATA